jgi:hypothetical protein
MPTEKEKKNTNLNGWQQFPKALQSLVTGSIGLPRNTTPIVTLPCGLSLCPVLQLAVMDLPGIVMGTFSNLRPQEWCPLERLKPLTCLDYNSS